MAKFIYTARNQNGETSGGELSAADEKSLAQQLRSEGYLVTSIKKIEEEGVSQVSIKFFDRFTGIPLKEKMMFARNLSVMISSGLMVAKAIHNLGSQTRNRRFQKVLTRLYDELQAGKTLSEALALYPGIFNDLFVNMVRVGETGGNLEEVLSIIATQLEKEHELISKVRGAMVYPAVILVAMVLVGFIMLTYILPKLTSVFEDMGVELPATTKAIISVSKFLQANTLMAVGGMAALAVFLKFFLQTSAGKTVVSFLTVNLPVIRNLVIKVNCARFARIYSSLLRSGVSVVDSLRIVSRTLTNTYYRQELEQAIDGVQRGQDLSVIISQNQRIFPVLVSQMIEVGEQTGKTEAVLQKLAEFYEEEVFQITKNMSSIIEPVLMLFIGAAVGFFAVSMLQPMYGLLENIQ